MAIAFARCRFLSRGKGHNAVHSAAYNMRAAMWCERTGQWFGRGLNANTLAAHIVLVPSDGDRQFEGAPVLWNLAENAERRRNSQTAFELVLALDPSLSDQERAAQVTAFAQKHFVDKGLAVQVDIHRPHATADTEAEKVNYHAHLLVTTRRIEGDRLARRKARDIAPMVRRLWGRAVVVQAEQWGASWSEFQDEWFRSRKKEIRVDPIAEFPGEHLGPKRFRHPTDPRIAEAADRKILNRQERAWIDRAASGHKLTVETVARRLSPNYAAALAVASGVKDQIRKVEWARGKMRERVADAKRSAEQRWTNMSWTRRAFHAAGKWLRIEALTDVEMQEFDKRVRRAERGFERFSIRRVNLGLQLNKALAVAEAEFLKAKPEAEAKLVHLEALARSARAETEASALQARQSARPSHRQRR